VAISRTGEMYCWGATTNGQLGIKTTQSSLTTPTLVEGFEGKQVRNIACAGGIRAGHSIVSLEIGDAATAGYQGASYVPAAKPEVEEVTEETKKPKKKKRAARPAGTQSGAMMKKMKEVIESVEDYITGVQSERDSLHEQMVQLTNQKYAAGSQMAKLLAEGALSEDPTHAQSCQEQVAGCEKKIFSISSKYFKVQQKKDQLIKDELTKRREFAEMMTKMQAQQDAQSVRRNEAMQTSVQRNLKEHK